MFTIYHRSDKDACMNEYIEGVCGLALGSAAVLRDGVLVKAPEEDCPEYIIVGCQRMNGTYPATRVHPDTVFAAPCKDFDAADTGTKVMLSEDALGVTNTPGGAFVVDGMCNAHQPDGKPIVKGRFGNAKNKHKSHAEYFAVEARSAKMQATAARNSTYDTDHSIAEYYAEKASHMEWAAKAAELLEGGAVRPIDANSFSGDDFRPCTDTEECMEVVCSKKTLRV